MKKTIVLIALFIIALADHSVFAQKDFCIQGFMYHTDLEGGCWYLQANDKKYELVGSEEQMRTVRVEGKHLNLNVKQATMMQSVCMIGTMVRILEILDTNFYARDPVATKMQIKGRIAKTASGCYYVLTSTGKKYELQQPMPKTFKRIKTTYRRLSNVIAGSEGKCNMDGVIINVGRYVTPAKQTKQIYNDPR